MVSERLHQFNGNETQVGLIKVDEKSGKTENWLLGRKNLYFATIKKQLLYNCYRSVAPFTRGVFIPQASKTSPCWEMLGEEHCPRIPLQAGKGVFGGGQRGRVLLTWQFSIVKIVTSACCFNRVFTYKIMESSFIFFYFIRVFSHTFSFMGALCSNNLVQLNKNTLADGWESNS